MKFSKVIIKNLIVSFLIICSVSFAQEDKPNVSLSKKGSFYAYWGWNRSMYSSSDISFKGNNYDFTLYDVAATDRQSPFDLKLYLNPGTITIPQYNLRIGYFLNDKYEISVGVDHMKYVMRSYQPSSITGAISKYGPKYDGVYSNNPFDIKPDFLMFEHTDGLNYINSELRRNDKLFEKGKIALNFLTGAGTGVVIPRTNCTLLGNPRYDQFHLAGFGLDALVGLNIEFYNRFFIQTEFKAGYINLPSIRTSMFKTDIAKQSFTFLQSNIVFGYRFNTQKENK
jgi:hypothetical protein